MFFQFLNHASLCFHSNNPRNLISNPDPKIDPSSNPLAALINNSNYPFEISYVESHPKFPCLISAIQDFSTDKPISARLVKCEWPDFF